MEGKIYEDALYEYYTMYWEEQPTTIRRCKATNVVEVMADDNLAKAHGFENMRHMVEHKLGYPGLSDSLFEQLMNRNKWVAIGQILPSPSEGNLIDTQNSEYVKSNLKPEENLNTPNSAYLKTSSIGDGSWPFPSSPDKGLPN